jgi:hypothetical protein
MSAWAAVQREALLVVPRVPGCWPAAALRERQVQQAAMVSGRTTLSPLVRKVVLLAAEGLTTA